MPAVPNTKLVDMSRDDVAAFLKSIKDNPKIDSSTREWAAELLARDDQREEMRLRMGLPSNRSTMRREGRVATFGVMGADAARRELARRGVR